MKRSLTMVLLLSLLIPAVSVTVMAGIGMGVHEKAMERVVESYVLNVAGNMAARVSITDLPPSRVGEIMNRMEHFSPFTWGPELPGWVAVLDSDRRLLFASSHAQPGLSSQAIDMALNRAVRVRDANGELSTIAVYPAGGRRGYYVMAAVQWKDFLGPMLNSGMIWLSLILILFFSCAAALLMLWRWIVGPLQRLVDDIDLLRWGDAIVPIPEREAAVMELHRRRMIMHRLSIVAQDRLLLWNHYTSDMIRVQEGEKDRAAREIHDGPVQAVTALVQRIRLSRLDDSRRDENLHVAEEIGVDTVRDLRELCNQLAPPWLDLGLEHALTELTDRLRRYLNMEIQIEIDDGDSLTPEKTLAFFRIVQEALSNAAQHGKATKVLVKVDRVGDSVTRLTVADNGVGFEAPDDLEILRAQGHRGLLNMNERISLAGGSMKIVSEEGQGATLIFLIPDDGVVQQLWSNMPAKL